MRLSNGAVGHRRGGICPSRNALVWPVALCLGAALPAGCQWAVDDADREVYRLIESRQQAALGRSSPARIDSERWPDWKRPYGPGPDQAYDFVPHPVEPGVLELPENPSSRPAGSQPVEGARLALPGLTTWPASGPAGWAAEPGEAGVPATRMAETHAAESQPADLEAPLLTLTDALHYAFAHAREFQTAKEDLYLAALALSLERHLWTPRLMGDVRTRYANYGQIRDFDHAMDVVAQTAVEQKLPYGGEVTAQVIQSLMRDLTNHLTSGETGAAVLEANIPLLRGAGPAAYESRYQAERDLIYAVRTFERFRQAFAVDIAEDYFELQQLKQAIANVSESIDSFSREAVSARARWQTGRVIELEVQRAEQDRLRTLNSRIDAIEAYRTAQDAFKVRLGMPTDNRFDVEPVGDPAEDLEAGPTDLAHLALAEQIRMHQIGEDEAVRLGLKYRLDLINVLDRIDDRRRGVDIAENNLLPSLNARGSVRWDTNPDTLRMLAYDVDRATWRGQLDLELPLDRKAERNALRTALIDQRRATRSYEEARDQVEIQVRRAMRRVQQQQESLRIQILSRDLALQRRRGARIRFEQGRVSNREIVDAENSLLSARNSLARAQVALRSAVAEFMRDTGLLRAGDEDETSPTVAGMADSR